MPSLEIFPNILRVRMQLHTYGQCGTIQINIIDSLNGGRCGINISKPFCHV